MLSPVCRHLGLLLPKLTGKLKMEFCQQLGYVKNWSCLTNSSCTPGITGLLLKQLGFATPKKRASLGSHPSFASLLPALSSATRYVWSEHLWELETPNFSSRTVLVTWKPWDGHFGRPFRIVSIRGYPDVVRGLNPFVLSCDCRYSTVSG